MDQLEVELESNDTQLVLCSYGVQLYKEILEEIENAERKVIRYHRHLMTVDRRVDRLSVCGGLVRCAEGYGASRPAGWRTTSWTSGTPNAPRTSPN